MSCVCPSEFARLADCPVHGVTRGRAVLDIAIADGAAERALHAVRVELARARGRFSPMASPHEGHSVIREEFEELWEHVRADTGRTLAAREEAIQLAAMALRYVVDVCDGAPPA